MNKPILVFLFFAILTIPLSTAVHCSKTAYSEDTWNAMASMPTARYALGVISANSKIYAIGGISNSIYFRTNEMYDPDKNEWVTKASMPTPRADLGIAAYENKIFCIGGQTNGNPLVTNEMYNPAIDSWSTVAAIPTPRAYLTANVVNGKIYLIGGRGPGAVTTDTNWVYDISANSWTAKTPMPIPAYSYSSAVIGSKIYIIGGYANPPNPVTSPNVNRVQIYDCDTDIWSAELPLPDDYLVTISATMDTHRRDMVFQEYSLTEEHAIPAAATQGMYAPQRIYLFGQNTWVYNPLENTWTLGATMVPKRAYSGVASVDELLYVIGGIEGANLTYVFSNNERYVPYGFGSVPPKVSIVSPRDSQTYSSRVDLVFTVNRELANVTGLFYSLDGQDNIPIAENGTLESLPNGNHSVILYATDTFGNTGTSEAVSFAVAESVLPSPSETFPTPPPQTPSTESPSTSPTVSGAPNSGSQEWVWIATLATVIGGVAVIGVVLLKKKKSLKTQFFG